jgi:hypothetical protein
VENGWRRTRNVKVCSMHHGRTRLNEIDAEIAQAVRLMAEKDLHVVLGGAGASVAAKRAQEMRIVLERMWRQRRQAWEQLQEV